MITEKYTGKIWIFLVESFSSVVSDLQLDCRSAERTQKTQYAGEPEGL